MTAAAVEATPSSLRGNRMNAVILARGRLPFRSSPDKRVELRNSRRTLRFRGTGRLCKGDPAGQEGFAAAGPGLCPCKPNSLQTPLIPPLSGGKRVGNRFLPRPAASCDCPAYPPYRAALGPAFPINTAETAKASRDMTCGGGGGGAPRIGVTHGVRHLIFSKTKSRGEWNETATPGR
jgi:hypothetical protein